MSLPLNTPAVNYAGSECLGHSQRVEATILDSTTMFYSHRRVWRTNTKPIQPLCGLPLARTVWSSKTSFFVFLVKILVFFDSGILIFSNSFAPIAKKNEIRGNKVYIDLGFAGIYSTMFRDFPRFFCFVVKFGRFLDIACPGIFRIWPQNKKI